MAPLFLPSAQLGRFVGGLAALLFALCLLQTERALADVLDVSGPLRGVALGRRMELLEDPSASLPLERATSPELRARWQRVEGESASFGFTSSAYWVRVRVKNTRAEERAWLLELGYPLIDEVALYTPREDGRYEVRRSGDMLPFAQRDLASRNVVFSLNEPPSSERTYYLRVVTTGSMNLPFTAWSLREFVEHQHLDWALLCIFYGVLLIMACYSVCVYAVAKQDEYLPYAGYVVCVFAFQFTIAGHTFEFLLPDEPSLVHRLIAVFLLLSFAFAARVARSGFPSGHVVQRLGRLVSWVSLALIAPSTLAPYGLMMELLTLSALLVFALVPVVTLGLARIHSKEARLFLTGWSGAIVGGLTSTLVSLSWLPVNGITKWSTQIGITLQLVLLSAAYADKYKAARRELAELHERLSHKVSDLSSALARAEQARESARLATRLKNEFMATMSHEFRTPLNPIINIPQGVRQEFVPLRRAACGACGARFELDDGDVIGPDTACPECAQRALSPAIDYAFVGDGKRTRALLSKVEHSGRHLLTVVNGILDFSKLQAGHVSLARECTAVSQLTGELVRTFGARAAERMQTLDLDLPDGDLAIDADPARLMQVLGCLVDNALKYSDAGGNVVVRARRHGEECVLSVSDRGIGIARENYERIFQSFEQVHKGNTRRYGGTGLGLAIARSLVRMHGGELTVQSEPGHGSTFSFALPLSATRAEQRSA